MVNDITLLKLFSKRDVMEKYLKFVNTRVLEPEIRQLLQEMQRFLQETETIQDIDFNIFKTYFLQFKVSELPEDQVSVYSQILTQCINEEVSAVDPKRLLEEYKKLEVRDYLEDMTQSDFNLEKCIAYVDTIKDEQLIILEEKLDKDTTSWEFDELWKDKNDENKFSWRLDFLNKRIGKLQPKWFYIVAGFVSVGKSTFVSSEVAFILEQLTDEKILWLTNEENVSEVKKRLQRSVIGWPKKKITADLKGAAQLFNEMVPNIDQKLICIDITGYNIGDVELLLQKYKPVLTIIDQIDHINCKQKNSWSGDHHRLGFLYYTIKSYTKQYGSIIGISQVNASTQTYDWHSEKMKRQKFIDQSQLDGAKVGKAAVADVVLTLGRADASQLIRGLFLAKFRHGFDNIGKEIRFRGDIAQYEDTFND